MSKPRHEALKNEYIFHSNEFTHFKLIQKGCCAVYPTFLLLTKKILVPSQRA